MISTTNILKDTLEGKRLEEEEALFLLEEGDFLELGKAAAYICNSLHPQGVATFIIDRNINYTNICNCRCLFCAFFREGDDPEAYVLKEEDIYKKVEEAVEKGATQIMLQGGLNPQLGLDYFTRLFRGIKKGFPVTIHSLSPPEICHIARVSGISLEEALGELKKAGLDSLPGGGAEILEDEIREKISPFKIKTDQWLQVMEAAHGMGMTSTATMMIGSEEKLIHRIKHMSRIRKLQDKGGGFRAFIMWSFQPGNTEMGGKHIGPLDYLKTLAVARLFLDNISHLQGSWVTQGKEIGQLSLAFGANDLGSIMIEENVIKSTGVSYRMTEEDICHLIKKAGKLPAQRDTTYRIIKEYYPSN